MTPQVSVIIPVYNSVDYVREAIQSVREQTIDRDAVEILAVDDGSTDGSDAVLAELAAEDLRITVITQENSGTPGGGRNPAIGRARGDFLFFLDSDDRLTPDALRRMVEVARTEGSDVVLGKMTSTDRRQAPSTMFRRTILDADLVEHKVFNTLGPTKLIRREVIESHDLRFPEDQKVGEDQPFMAAVYLNARKISILADMDYYVIRHRTDGSNLTLVKQSSESQFMIAVRLSEVIEQYTEPGESRDALLKRPMGWTMKRALDSRWQGVERAEQERLGELFRSRVGHLYTEGVRRVIEDDIRSEMDLLMAGDLDGLQAYSSYLAGKPTRRLTYSDGAFRRHLPESVAHLVPPDELVVDAPRMLCRLEDVRIDGRRVMIAATVRIPDLDGAPDSIMLRARKRNDEEIADFRIVSEDLTPGASTFAVGAEHDGLDRGVWDVVVAVRFGEFEKTIRLGSDRARTIEPEGETNLADDPTPQDRVIAYFTQGHGNLSIDQGGVMHRKLAGARAVGFTLDENGRAVMLVETTSEPTPQDEYFGHLEGVHQHGGRQLLPAVRLGERLIGLRLPLTAQMVGATVAVSAVLGDAKTPLRASGTEFWPARAAGFGLSLDEDGALRVTAPGDSGRNRMPLPTFDPRTRSERLWAVRERAASKVGAVPVLGPALVRAARRLRDRRS
ncbi:glycosyltransferase family 2 protein [Brachybacterium fresconis]|uniref:Glycosyltransferase involved in cell wall biosynthesis n=1 Tax=Brachybacterium fresconis TaxID=173363 RepID=A0ABS4YJ93_9MICO|nr:glycosyltransferase family 2 protein [Brachybacterium fresconis]MBP2408866.1 glycosyltransferase involved in cell wall biosynthesis [Brachybacterium fresconis]